MPAYPLRVHTVFLHVSNLGLAKNLSPDLLAELCGVAPKLKLADACISVCKAVWSGHNRKSCRAGDHYAIRAAAAMDD